MSKPNAKQVADALRCSAFGGGVPCCECYFLRIEDGHKVCSAGGIDEAAADLIEEMGKEIQHLRGKAKDLADLLTRKPKVTINAPAVDAVEVVRCRDCKNLLLFADRRHGCARFPSVGTVAPLDYCSRGELRK